MDDLKKKLLSNYDPEEKPVKKPKMKRTEKEFLKAKSVLNKKSVLDAPLHRQAKTRIEGQIAYSETR